MIEKSRFSDWLPAFLLALVTLALYWPATEDAFLHYDDSLYVTENAHVQNGLSPANIRWAFGHPVTGNWHPLTMVSHMLDCQVYGLRPWGHHLTSLLLHALNTALVFLLLRRLTGAVWRSALVAALFGWHPVNVESVAWVAERKSVLSAFWGLLALLFYVCYAQGIEVRRQTCRAKAERRESEVRPTAPDSSFFILHSSFSYCLSLLCLALGLMSKSLLVTWPFVMLLLDYWPLGRSAPILHSLKVREKIPFFALAVAISVATLLTHQQEGDIITLPWSGRVANTLVSDCRYLEKIFWPANLAVFYPHPGHWPLAETLAAGALLAGVSALFWLWRRRYPFLLMGWLWFLGTLVPVVGLVQVGVQAMADRHAYIPSLGIFILTVWGAGELARRWRGVSVAGPALGMAALILCLALTRHQLGYWQDDETLFRRALAVTQDNFVAHNNLGIVLGSRGQLDAAINQFQEAIRIQPNYADAHYNLGNALLNQGRTDAAISQFQTAFQLETYDAGACHRLGNLLARQGRLDEAIGLFEEAIRQQPDYPIAHNSLGAALAAQGRLDEAIREFQEALRLKPDYSGARTNLARALALKPK